MSNPTKTAERLHVENLVASEHARVKREQAILDREAMQTQKKRIIEAKLFTPVEGNKMPMQTQTKAKEKAGHTKQAASIQRHEQIAQSVRDEFLCDCEVCQHSSAICPASGSSLILEVASLRLELAETKAQRDLLLEACKYALDCEEEPNSKLGVALRAAIAKATEGQPKP